MEKSQERTLFRYEFKLGHKAAEATEIINSSFEADAVTERITRRWFEKFRSGDLNLQSEPRGHLGPSIDNDELRFPLESDTRQTVRDIAEKLDVHYSTVPALAITWKGEKARQMGSACPYGAKHGTSNGNLQFFHHHHQRRNNRYPV